MKKSIDLKSYLHLWKEHFSADVEGQSAQTQHLDEAKLKKMVEAGGINNADPVDIEHLSTCPACLEEWSRLCAQSSEGETNDSVAPLSIFYGTIEDDVTGQCATSTLTSGCGRFTLTIKSSQQNQKLSLTLIAAESDLEGHSIQVRAKEGQLLLDGQVQDGQLTTEITDLNGVDMSIWTVIVG